jgi:nucleotide-binding universal stress UspA family protein
MFTNILVGVDGGLGGRDAIALARRLGAERSTLTLAHVYPGDAHFWRGSANGYDPSERRRVLEMLAQAREQADVTAELRCVRSASIGRGLHQLAESLRADLLIVGSSVHGLFGRVLLGDDARDALNVAPCAVAVAPSGYSHEAVAIREIGVAYNGSVESEHAVAVARALAAEHGARLSAFEAVSLPTYALLGGADALDAAVDDLVVQARARIETLGGVEPHAAYGNPIEELTVYSASLDLLVVGSRDYGPIGRLVHGSTSQQLARTARCPLLVLTRAARHATAPDQSHEHRDVGAAASV